MCVGALVIVVVEVRACDFWGCEVVQDVTVHYPVVGAAAAYQPRSDSQPETHSAAGTTVQCFSRYGICPGLIKYATVWPPIVPDQL